MSKQPKELTVWEKYGVGDPDDHTEMFKQMEGERFVLTPSERADLNEARAILLRGMRERGEDKHWTPELADLPICDTFAELARRVAAAKLSIASGSPASTRA